MDLDEDKNINKNKKGKSKSRLSKVTSPKKTRPKTSKKASNPVSSATSKPCSLLSEVKVKKKLRKDSTKSNRETKLVDTIKSCKKVTNNVKKGRTHVIDRNSSNEDEVTIKTTRQSGIGQSDSNNLTLVRRRTRPKRLTGSKSTLSELNAKLMKVLNRMAISGVSEFKLSELKKLEQAPRVHRSNSLKRNNTLKCMK